MNPNPNGPADGAGTDPNNAPNAGAATGGAPANGPAGDGQSGGQEPQLGPDGQPWDADRAARLVANLRAELAEAKQKTGGQQGQGQEPAPQQPQQQAGQEPATDDGSAAELTATKTELAIFRTAGKHGADPSKLTDSRSFMDKVADLPAEDRDKKLGELIKKTLDTHPHYATGQAPGGTSPRGGSDGTGRPGAPNQPTDLTSAVSAHYSKK